MDWSHKLLFTTVLVVGVTINGARGDAMVTGTVFCDQCRDGQISLYDYPLYGIKVTMSCPGSDGQYTTWGEETTNWLGNYGMRISGSPNLSGCYTQVSKGQGSNACGAGAGPANQLKLMFNMFGTEMYTVDPLLSQPAQPMSFCSSSSTPAPVVPVTPSPVRQLPTPLPLPQLPVTRLPPMPLLEASACPHQKWLMPEYKCYWKVVIPDTKVAIAFGLIAARRYGTDITLGHALLGRGDPYKTLLREATTALLNSYNSIQFPYHPLGVVEHVNWALMGSTRQVLHTALSFIKANSGNGTNTTCKFTLCK